MKISVIIPTYNEERYVGKLIDRLQKYSSDKNIEIIVCDGGSNDNTENIIKKYNIKFLKSPERGRALQMNYAASFASGDIFYFIHADCMPPESCFQYIEKAVYQNYDAGCFRSKFDSNRTLLKLNAFFTRFGGLICRGGDQSMFVKKEVFIKLDGFSEKYIIMEDYDFVRRLRKKYSFIVLPDYAFISARKYENNSWVKVNFANAVAFYMFASGTYSPQRIRNTYHSMIKHPKEQ